jgi:hypothetical protein
MIKILDAIAGAGKTHAILKQADALARSGRRVSISLPTRAVIDEKHGDATRLAEEAYPVLKVYSGAGDDQRAVGARLDDVFTSLSPREGAVLFTTHKTFNECPNWMGRHDWKFFVDEVYDPVAEIRLRVPRTYDTLTRYLELETPDEAFSKVRLVYGGRTQLERMLSEIDDGEERLHRIVRYLLHPERWAIYVKTNIYKIVTSGIGRSQCREDRDRAAVLVFWVEAKPWFANEGLDVTLSSACLTDRLLYKVWRNAGAEFVPDGDLASDLRVTRHDGHGLRLHCMNIDRWSAYAKTGGARYGADLEGVATPERALEQLIAREFEGQPFIYSANDAWTNDHLFEPNGLRVKVVLHGRNDFSAYRHVAFMPSLLPVPDKYELIRWRGHSADDIADEYYHSHAYQTVFRTAARSPDRHGDVDAIVPGRLACQYIQEKAPGAEIVEHDVSPPRRPPGRPRNHTTKEEGDRARAQRVWMKRNPGRTASEYRPRRALPSATVVSEAD